MRVIAGALKGRRLDAPRWPGLRPTSDKLRETLFNILGAAVEGSRVLDGYAGTGAIGIEALSRGAREVAFVERDRRAVALIEANLRRCGVAEGYAIIRAAFEDATRTRLSGAAFDLVILDPPYAAAPERALEAAAGVLAAGGLVALEHAARRPAPERAGALARQRVVTSGDSALTFYTSTSLKAGPTDRAGSTGEAARG